MPDPDPQPPQPRPASAGCWLLLLLPLPAVIAPFIVMPIVSRLGLLPWDLNWLGAIVATTAVLSFCISFLLEKQGNRSNAKIWRAIASGFLIFVINVVLFFLWGTAALSL